MSENIMNEIKVANVPAMETFYDFLENFVTKINMDPITRANVQKSTVVKPKFLSGIIIIA